ncbi:MAG: hypothetical protein QW320_06585 [Ignisphaera sp.]|uniref:hypothetical protein n=1 Tax=Thermofilum sp. TaxID=1961369 RepID=UPI00316ABAA7
MSSMSNPSYTAVFSTSMFQSVSWTTVPFNGLTVQLYVFKTSDEKYLVRGSITFGSEARSFEACVDDLNKISNPVIKHLAQLALVWCVSRGGLVRLDRGCVDEYEAML